MADDPAESGGPRAEASDHGRRIAALEAENQYLRSLLAGTGRSVDPVAEGDTGPFFVGGTGRSGTWILGRLLDKHPAVTAIHTELRFHSDEGGFCGVLDGSQTPEEYAQRVRDRWFNLTAADGGSKGLRLVATSKQLNQATQLLVTHGATDMAAGLRAFTHELVDPYAFGRGTRTWVETTPANSSAVDCLMEVFPNGRAIDIVRDGRDSASSVVSMKSWGPKTLTEGLDWWEKGVRAADASIARAPEDRVLLLRFEEFALTHRDERLTELFEFCELPMTRDVQRYMHRRVDPEDAHVGRWRSSMSKRQATSFSLRYSEIYDRMVADGIRCLPIAPDVADELQT